MNDTSWSHADLAYIIENHYGIDPVQAIKPILAGASSACYHIITPEENYLLKDVQLSIKNHPHLEPNVNERLLEHNLPVAKFIKASNGDYRVNYKNHTFHLQTFIKGESFDFHTAPDWFLEESAILLAKIHKALETFPMLPSGIGPHFFKVTNKESARESYESSLKLATYNNEFQYVKDLEYRLSLLERLPDIDLILTRFTYKNTHGDYNINHILCDNEHIQGIIKFNACCTHPACWELIRSYSYADPKCISGALDTQNLISYIENYLKFNRLNVYDIKMMPYLYYYQLAFSDYFKAYYNANPGNRDTLAYYAHWSTLLLQWLETNVETLSLALDKHFNSI